MIGIRSVVLLVGLLPVLGGIAGIVLFIVGLVKKRASLWGSGIALAVVSALVLVVGVVFAGFLAFRSSTTAAMRVAATARMNQQAASQAVHHFAFTTCTGLDLPDGALVLGVRNVLGPPPASRDYYLLKLQAPAAFETLLKKHFAPATWPDVRETLTSEPTASTDLWRPADLRNRTYYTRMVRDAPPARGRRVTTVAHDPNAGVAYLVSARQRDGQP